MILGEFLSFVIVKYKYERTYIHDRKFEVITVFALNIVNIKIILIYTSISISRVYRWWYYIQSCLIAWRYTRFVYEYSDTNLYCEKLN